MEKLRLSPTLTNADLEKRDILYFFVSSPMSVLCGISNKILLTFGTYPRFYKGIVEMLQH